MLDCTLVVFDQHAVDERIRLERLHREVEGEGGSKGVGSVQTNLEYVISLVDAEMIKRHRQSIVQWGSNFFSLFFARLNFFAKKLKNLILSIPNKCEDFKIIISKILMKIDKK